MPPDLQLMTAVLRREVATQIAYLCKLHVPSRVFELALSLVTSSTSIGRRLHVVSDIAVRPSDAVAIRESTGLTCVK